MYYATFSDINKEGMMISSWRRGWALVVGTGMLMWVSLVSLLLALTMLLHNPLPIKILLLCYSVLWLKIASITIWIHFEPDHHQRELVEAHHLSLSGNVWQHISSKYAKTNDYRMVDALPTISKAGAESDKWIHHGCALFVKWKTHMMRTGTAMPSLAENIFSSM